MTANRISYLDIFWTLVIRNTKNVGFIRLLRNIGTPKQRNSMGTSRHRSPSLLEHSYVPRLRLPPLLFHYSKAETWALNPGILKHLLQTLHVPYGGPRKAYGSILGLILLTLELCIGNTTGGSLSSKLRGMTKRERRSTLGGQRRIRSFREPQRWL